MDVDVKKAGNIDNLFHPNGAPALMTDVDCYYTDCPEAFKKQSRTGTRGQNVE